MPSRSHESIANRMAASILIFSIVLTLVSAAGFYAMNYHKAMNRVELNLRQVDRVNVQAINAALRTMDMLQLQVQLNSLLGIPRVTEVRVESNGRIVASAGTAGQDPMLRTFPLEYPFNDKTMPRNTLHVLVDKTDIYQDLFRQTVSRLLFQAVQIALLVLFIFYIFRCIVTRRLSSLEKHIAELNTGSLGAMTVLKKPFFFKGDDELDLLVKSFNIMLYKIEKGISEGKLSEEAIKALNNQLLAEIAGHRKTEEDLREAKATAESANIAKSQFVANMGHEIRTPMNCVIGMTQLLELTALSDEQREYVTSLKLSGRNLLSLINDVLDLSKIEAGKIEVVVAEFSLRQCIKDIVMIQKSVTDEKGLKLEMDIASDVPDALVGDELRIRQIILNLLGNAVKFTVQGGINVSVQLLEQHDTTVLVQVAVSDTGIGIPREALDGIFMPFIQVDGSTTRKYGGTGLGLTISRRLAELMGGHTSVSYSTSDGSCFTVTLPFPIGRGCGTTDLVLKETTVSGEAPPLRILYAEDNPVNLKFGTKLLCKLGHDVIAVKDGRECLSALEQGVFDLLLIDIQMPVMGGQEAVREIRKKEQGCDFHLPVIALTGFALRGDKSLFLNEGFDGYVSKPLEIRELVNEMNRVTSMTCEIIPGT